jgi:carbonic anhydrase/acetyltransferase-like protein (isoleucine patch superfamily)
VGRPGRVIRTADDADLDRLRALRDGDLSLPDDQLQTITGRWEAGATMGKLYAYRDIVPTVDPTAVLFDSAEVTGDVHIGGGAVIGAGVKIIGDSHGPVRIGARVQILENTVLHLLPDNELVIGDDVVIGPGAMIHGCRIGAGSVVEPAAIVCDGSTIGRGCVVRAGSLVKQRSVFADHAVVEGFPATQVDTLDAPPHLPAWALPPGDVERIERVR